MTEQELNDFHAIGLSEPTISIYELNNQDPRTLVYGYNCDGGGTVHVYIDENKDLQCLTYRHESTDTPPILLKHEFGVTLEISDIVPTKRSYPELCDFEFCKLIKEKGNHISMTRMGTYNKAHNPLTLKDFA